MDVVLLVPDLEISFSVYTVMNHPVINQNKFVRLGRAAFLKAAFAQTELISN